MSGCEWSYKLQNNPQSAAQDKERSSYFYLFPELAKEDNSGCFSGTDEQTSIQRLKEFDFCFRGFAGANKPPVMSMDLPAAYTYFGQFINHDISVPIGSLRTNVLPPGGIIGNADPDPAGLEKLQRGTVDMILKHFINDHAKPLTLASLYGDGPTSRYPEVLELYAADKKRFRLGDTEKAPDQFFIDLKLKPEVIVHARDADGTLARDIVRDKSGPLMADRRNDGNLILSQLHLAFMLVHNKAVDALEQQRPPVEDVFAKARQLVTRHYHWLILNDFLPSLLSRSVLTRPLAQWVPRKTDPDAPPYSVPLEFTTAAFRFGHSMVGQDYDYNANFGQGGTMSESATFADLFSFTSAGNMENPDSDPGQLLPSHWVIDWDRMTRPQQPGAAGARLSGRAEQIDMIIAPGMLGSAGDATKVAEHGSILFRNLLRGFHRRIPFGQRLAEACDVDRLSPARVGAALQDPEAAEGDASGPGLAAQRLGLLDQTPAWLYFLCEAKALEGGMRVGPTASNIIADTIVRLMRDNPASVLNYKAGTWDPDQSELRTRADKPLTSLRAFLMFATESG